MTVTPITAATDKLEKKLFERGDHVEIAERLITLLRSEAPCVFADGSIYQYGHASHVFAPTGSAVVSRRIQRFAGVMVRGEKKNHALRLRASDVGGVARLAEDQLAEPEFFTRAPSGIVFANGFVELAAERIIVREHSPENRARFAYPFAFSENAQPERFLRFLDEVFANDEDAREKRLFVQEFVGTSLLGLATRYQRAAVFVGDGSNGKGVLSQIAEAAFPDGSSCSIPPQDFEDQYRKAMLAGKLVNIVSELPEREILDSESFKAVISGDSTTGREIRKAPFTFRPIAGHLYSANRLPGTADHTHGFWRRFVVVRFNRVFAEHEQNPTLARDIINGELPAIVSWFLAGAQRVQLLGRYTMPASSTQALNQWRDEADTVKAFVEERLEPVDSSLPLNQWEAGDWVYTTYKGWCERNGHKPMSSIKLGVRLRLLGIEKQRNKFGVRYPVRRRPMGEGQQ